MFELMDTANQNAVIKVIGVGGGGGNAVQHMVDSDIEGAEFIYANTDAQALATTRAGVTVQLGSGVTKGLGAGADPITGREAAEESRERLQEVLDGADMVFITAGMGGGTGTGGAPVVAEVAREMGILAVAVVTKPFPFEGNKRMGVAEQGIKELEQSVDSLITIPNERLLPVLGKNLTLVNAFNSANDVLHGAVRGIAELITRPGLINVDFADVRTVMSEMGMAVMGNGVASGEGRAREAADSAIACPLLEDFNLSGANGVLVNVTGGDNLSIGEFDEVGNAVREYASDEATVVVGAVIDPALEEELRVTVVATGLGSAPQEAAAPAKAAEQVARKQTGEVDYSQLDRPTVLRQGSTANEERKGGDPEGNMEYLDIPAFLRRQAD
ncbi:MAG: cell division protein FtsZ [Halorhodospira sp.]